MFSKIKFKGTWRPYQKRVLEFATYIVENNATIRQTAKYFSMAKSTVHYDIQKRLFGINQQLYEKVKTILKNNFDEKHIRGGEATKRLYLTKK